MLRLALEFHALLAREGQIGSVPGAALALTVATLAVVHHHRLTRDFITDRAAGASAGVGLTHVFSPSILPAGDGADVLDKFLPNFAHGLEGRIALRRDEISFSQDAEWNALISKYIGSIPLSGDASYAAEHSISGGPPPRTPVSSAMTANVGAAARHSQSAARVAVLWAIMVFLRWSVRLPQSRPLSPCRTRRGGATRGTSRCVPWVRGRATGTCPRGRPLRANRWNRCGRGRRPRARTRRETSNPSAACRPAASRAAPATPPKA